MLPSRNKLSVPALIAVLMAPLAFPAGAEEADMEQRLDRLEERLEGRGLSELIRDMERVKGENRELRGAIERLERDLQRLQERQREHYADLDDRLQELRERAPEEGEEEASSSEEDEDETGNDHAEAAYQAAFEELGEGRYEEAREGFEEMLEEYPESDFQANAVYWIAETYYAEQAFDRATEAFQRLLEKHPDSDKVPDAQLKLGYIAFEQDELTTARERLEGVVEEHPETTAANLAQQRLSEIRQLLPEEQEDE
ncbi:MAG: tol-pal system protein YbgF [Halorhodospira sp.]